MKKNLLTVLILAFLIVNIVLTAIMMLSVLDANKQTTKLVSNIATVLNIEMANEGEESQTEEISLADTDFFVMNGDGKGLMFLLKSDEGDTKAKYMIFTLTLSMNMQHEDYEVYGATLDSKAELIKDALTTIISSHTEGECINNLEGLKTEILEAVQNLFKSEFIYQISISDVKFG